MDMDAAGEQLPCGRIVHACTSTTQRLRSERIFQLILQCFNEDRPKKATMCASPPLQPASWDCLTAAGLTASSVWVLPADGSLAYSHAGRPGICMHGCSLYSAAVLLCRLSKRGNIDFKWVEVLAQRRAAFQSCCCSDRLAHCCCQLVARWCQDCMCAAERPGLGHALPGAVGQGAGGQHRAQAAGPRPRRQEAAGVHVLT